MPVAVQGSSSYRGYATAAWGDQLLLSLLQWQQQQQLEQPGLNQMCCISLEVSNQTLHGWHMTQGALQEVCRH
jgi:hypothetical protein